MGFLFSDKKTQQKRAEVQENAAMDGNQEQINKEQTVLIPECIRIGLKSVTKNEAIEMAGQLLVDGGYVTSEYITAMKEREKVLSTYIGEGVAIPHGVGNSKDQIIHSGICILQFPEGVEYQEGEKAYLVVGIAGKDNQDLKILSALSEFIQESEALKQLFTTGDRDYIFQAFTNRF